MIEIDDRNIGTLLARIAEHLLLREKISLGTIARGLGDRGVEITLEDDQVVLRMSGEAWTDRPVQFLLLLRQLLVLRESGGLLALDKLFHPLPPPLEVGDHHEEPH